MKQRAIFITFAVLLISHLSFGETVKKEKKAITDLIKSEYATWSLTEKTPATSNELAVKANFSPQHQIKPGMSSTTEPMHATMRSYSYQDEATEEFSDFVFNIVENQAVVQFRVDDQLVSAFLEKENGQWKLVCAAKLDPSI